MKRERVTGFPWMLVSLLLALGCSHPKIIEITQQDECRARLKYKSKDASESAGGKDLNNKSERSLPYLARVKAALEPRFREGVVSGMNKLKADNARLVVATPKNELISGIMLSIAPDGKVAERKLVCGFGVPELDDALDAALSTVDHVDPPPVEWLKKGNLAKVQWNFVIED